MIEPESTTVPSRSKRTTGKLNTARGVVTRSADARRGRAPTAARSCPPRSAGARRAARRSSPGALEHRPDEAPHHVAEIAVGRDLEVEMVAAADPFRPLDDRGRRPCAASAVGVNARKSCSPSERRGCRVERVLVERPRHPPAAARLERRRRRAGEEPVAVAARARRVARVEVGRRLRGRRRPRSRRAGACSAPAAARSGGGPPSTSTETTCASAWTPVSVRPATARFSTDANVSASAARSAPSTVGSPGCAAQPRNGVPSYSSVRMSAHVRPS